jgi:uncharacterized membrane protein YfcA
MNISAGFVVLAFCGSLLVVVPSFTAAWTLWRLGGLRRIVTVAATGLMFGMVLLGFVGAELPRQLEEAVLSSLLFWGVSFYALVGLFVTGRLLRRIVEVRRRPSGPPSAIILRR